LRIFLDSSVALAAALSTTGASRQMFHLASSQGWELRVSPWVLREMEVNLTGKPKSATDAWLELREKVFVEDDVLTFEWPLIFNVTKDKPVLCTALACADVLLTLDRRDFGPLIGQTVYDLLVQTPGEFLRFERQAGRLV
jgi:predicted nucleic acid-binding protein